MKTLPLFHQRRISFLQLAGHSKYSELRYRQQFKKRFDFLRFNKTLVDEHSGGNYVIAIDPSFVAKSGKQTPGVGYFWSGQAGQAKRGLKILGITFDCNQ
ncbi:transposase [Anseongella ginsenosidimutans]|nr:transposase [Anseongella ginsenosidimutans]